MKKILFLAAATLSLAACSNDDNYIDQPVAAQISATISNSALSRASGTKWFEGDEIGITMTGNLVSYLNQKYTTDNGDGLFTGAAMYFKNHIDPLTLTAYYPYTGDEGTTPAAIDISTTGEHQTAKGQPDFDFLYAKLDNVTGRNSNVEFTFTHQMGKITLIFKDGKGADVSKITSYQIDGLVLDGTFDTATGVCAAKDVAPATLSMTTADVVSEKELPSLIVIPQSTADKTVRLKVTDSEDQDYACALIFNDDAIVAGNNYQFTVTVSKTGLTVNQSTITDWDTTEIGADADSDWRPKQ